MPACSSASSRPTQRASPGRPRKSPTWWARPDTWARSPTASGGRSSPASSSSPRRCSCSVPSASPTPRSANLSLSVREALLLFGLFWGQFVLGAVMPASAHGTERVIVSVVYVALGGAVLIRDRARLGRLLRNGFRVPHHVLRDGSTP